MIIRIYFLLGLLLLLNACGGGGGSSTSTTGFSQSYTTSASAGELLTYSINTAALTYSYTVTKSSYGCDLSTAACHSGSGTLVKNSDGTYSPSQSPTSKIFAAQNGLIAGNIVISLNGVNQTVPIFGVSNPITTITGLAGTYNSMSLQCTGKTYGLMTGCQTSYGTVSIATNGTFTSCNGANIAATPHTCTSTITGSIASLGNGTFQFQATTPAGAATNYFLAFTAPNGQVVGVVDFNDATVFGYGQSILSTSQSAAIADIAGTYVWNTDYGTSGTVTLNSTGTTSSGCATNLNSPWTGIATITGACNTGTGYGILAGNGVYVYTNPTTPSKPAYYELGLRIQ